MSKKLKALGLGLLAALAVSAVGVMNAGANTGGHFTAGDPNTTLTGENATGVNAPELHDPALGSLICKKASYHGEASETETEVTITPTYSECEVTVDELPVHVNMNGCDYTFSIGQAATEDNTVSLDCPVGKEVDMEVTGPFGTCTITIADAQNQNLKGVAYTTIEREGKHAITADLTVEGIHLERHGGFFLCGTSTTTTNQGELTGKAILWGEGEFGNPVDITAVGESEM